MTDERAVFIEEVVSRGEIARASKKRAGYTRYNKSFAQPSENHQILRKKNGEIMEYKIGQPISWAEFKTYPLDMQQKWVDAFAEKFKCGAKGLAIVFGVAYSTIFTLCKRTGLAMPKCGIYNETKGDLIRAWMAEQPEPAPVEAVEPKKPEPKRAEPKKPELPYYVNTLRSGTMGLEGNATEMFHTLFGIFRDAQLKLDIYFTVVPPEPEPVEEPDPEPAPVEATEATEAADKVHLNKCFFRDLRAIGVSPNIAASIIQARPFQTVDDLAKVPGISKSYFNILREKVTVYDEA